MNSEELAKGLSTTILQDDSQGDETPIFNCVSGSFIHVTVSPLLSLLRLYFQ